MAKRAARPSPKVTASGKKPKTGPTASGRSATRAVASARPKAATRRVKKAGPAKAAKAKPAGSRRLPAKTVKVATRSVNTRPTPTKKANSKVKAIIKAGKAKSADARSAKKVQPRKVAVTSSVKAAPVTKTRPAARRPKHAPKDPRPIVQSPPSSLDMNRRGTAARTGRAEIAESRADHATMTPSITGGDVDANVEDAYFTGDEAPGGDNTTPDQDVVDDIGKALGVEYQDNEELRGSDKVADRDKHRWELDPASAEDYRDRK